MTVQLKSLNEVNHLAIRLLSEQIGVADTLRFISQFTTGHGNYTAERDVLFGQMTWIRSSPPSTRAAPARKLGRCPAPQTSPPVDVCGPHSLDGMKPGKLGILGRSVAIARIQVVKDRFRGVPAGSHDEDAHTCILYERPRVKGRFVPSWQVSTSPPLPPLPRPATFSSGI